MHDFGEMPMDARKHLIIIKGKDQTDSVASFQFRNGKCEVVYTSAPNKTYNFQSSNVEILPLQKKIDPAQVIVTANGQTISEIDELLDFGGYYRIVRKGKRDLSFHRSEVQFQQNCLTDGKNQETFQYFKETAAAISLVAENGINILSMQYDKIQQVSEDTVLASYLAPQKDVKMPQMPEAVIYPFGLNQSQKLAVERALSSKISIIQGPPGTGKTQTILNIIANVVRSGKTVAVVSNNNSATHNVVEKLEKKNAAFLTAFLGSLANKERFLDAQTGAYPNMSDWEMPPEEQQQLDQETTALSKELNEMLNAKNRIAEIEQEFLQLNPEQHYFEEYYASYSDAPMESLDKLSSRKLLALWMEFEQHAERETRLGLLQKISIMFRFNRNALKLFIRSPEQVIPYLQNQFYFVKRRELEAEKQELNRKLERYAFDAKMDELTQKSLRLFRAELAARYQVPLYVRDGASNIREDWMFAYGKAQGRFVTIAHQDDRYRSDYAEKLLKAWKKYPDLLLFASDYLTIRMTEKEGEMKAIPEPFNMVWLVKKILRLPLRFHFLADRTWIKRSSVWFGNSICCPSCTYNKEQIGDDMFHSEYDFALDWDNLYELAGKKGRFICSEKPLIAYRVHAAATTKACIEDNRRPAISADYSYQDSLAVKSTLLHLLRKHTEEISDTHCRLQNISFFKSHFIQGIIDTADYGRACIMGI